MNWHTKLEKRIIRKYKGKPLSKYGYDGTINGKPTEVRAVRKDHRFRIQKDVHKDLVNKKGSYLFVKGNKNKKLSAKKVSKLIGKGKWYKDRSYPHKFVYSKDIFKR